MEANGSATYLTKVTAPDGAATIDIFGNSVSQSGNILAVGAQGADSGGISDAGAAYTFDISGHITAIQIEGNSTEVNTAGTTNWLKMKTITLAADSTVKEVKNELKNDSTNGACIPNVKFYSTILMVPNWKAQFSLTAIKTTYLKHIPIQTISNLCKALKSGLDNQLRVMIRKHGKGIQPCGEPRSDRVILLPQSHPQTQYLFLKTNNL